MKKNWALFLTVIVMGNIGISYGQAPSVSVESFDQEMKKLDDGWDSAKQDYKKKYDQLIGKLEAGIKERDFALDNGNPKTREQLVKERKHLEITRDHTKRQLAEISAATTVDWMKLKEEVQQKLKEMTGGY